MTPGLNPIASGIIGGAFKILFPSTAERVDGIREIASGIQGLKGKDRASRALPRRLEDAADRIAEKLDRIPMTEMSEVDQAERKLALEGVQTALNSINVTHKMLAKDVVSTPGRLVKALEPVAAASWRRSELSEAGWSYGRFLLHESCLYVEALVKTLPGVESEVVWDTYVLTRKIDEMLERAVVSVIAPDIRDRSAIDAARFEADYRTDVTVTYQYTDLFGLNLPSELRRHPVEIAYIRLRSSSGLGAYTEAGRTDGTSPESQTVDEAIGHIARAAASTNRGARILLTGVAGSGKTTIAHWLAIHLAGRKLTSSLSIWRDCVPFVVPLRSLFLNRAQPSYASMVGPSTYRDLPGLTTWVVEALNSGNAVVILDGLDELADHASVDATTWMEKLFRDHPRATFVVTSRPDGVDDRWVVRNHFQQLRLLPMNRLEAKECIERWFDALLSATRPRDQLDYRARREQLLHDLDSRPAVRDLSETPLLCAMLCAFYANSVVYAIPRTRIELYRRVITALIDLRDRDRRVYVRPDDDMSYRQKKLLLQAIARHMSDRSLNTIRIEPLDELIKDSKDQPGVLQQGGALYATLHATTAVDVVRSEFEGIVSLRMDATDALRLLLRRSVVFRGVGPNEAQFVHRSIQEFLTGQAYAYNDDIETLVARAGIQQWRRVIVFAAGAARNKKSSSEVVSTLLDQADSASNGDERRALLLLAAECMSAAGQVTAVVADRAKSAITEVLPPRNQDEARLLGLDEETRAYLRYTPGMSIDVARACIVAASRIRGSAVEEIEGFARSPLVKYLASDLADAWDWFDSEEYAQRVLAHVPLAQEILRVRQPGQVSAAASIPEARSIKVEQSCDITDLNRIAELTALRDLDCAGSESLNSLDGLADATQLSRLNLSRCNSIADFGALRRTTRLRELYLTGCVSFEDLTSVTGNDGLRVLFLDGCVSVRDFAPLGALTALQTLSLDDCSVYNVDFCRDMTQLRTLWARSMSTGIEDMSGIEQCVELERIRLNLSPARPSRLRLPFPRLKFADLTGAVTADDIHALESCGSLARLRCAEVKGLSDLRALSACHELRGLAVERCPTLDDVADLSGCRQLEEVNLSGSNISSISVAANWPNLRRITLDGCSSLTDISALHHLPTLEFVSLVGVPGVTDGAVRKLRARATPILVDHYPYPDLTEPITVEAG